MPDRSTLGYEAEPSDVAAHLADFTDLLELYARASAENALLLAAARAATAYKARALALLHRDGYSYEKIATMVGISETRSGVQKLVEQGRTLLAQDAELGIVGTPDDAAPVHKVDGASASDLHHGHS
ncbi:hypothetical protein ACIBG8_14600 [Nonomuraea sp. NPDC050556]|uniref:hypothetical protein n=1 Tax=Nonomuraea sp. NPDC050556 TaxID=3364369 RepID=UPI003798CE67